VTLGKQIAAHYERLIKCEDKAEQHKIAIGQLLMQAKEAYGAGGFTAFRERFCPNPKGRADERDSKSRWSDGGSVMTERQCLPARRSSTTFDFECGSHRFVCNDLLFSGDQSARGNPGRTYEQCAEH
jgi:hypothetical protein